MLDVIVVGAGIVGATIAKSLQEDGREVLCIDRGEPNSGTRPSGGHLKASWLGLPYEQYKPGMDVLEKTWGLVRQDFLFKGELTSVDRVDTDLVLAWDGAVSGNVVRIEQLSNFPKVIYRQTGVPGLMEARCRLLILAAGVWTNELLRQHGVEIAVKSKQGISFRVNHQIDTPFIQQWAPYKQIVCHQQTDDQVWIGDGTSILQENWNDGRNAECLQRCLGALGVGTAPFTSHIGYRPSVAKDGDICLMDNPFPKVWVVTGASKRGTIAAGCAAHKFLQMGM